MMIAWVKIRPFRYLSILVLTITFSLVTLLNAENSSVAAQANGNAPVLNSLTATLVNLDRLDLSIQGTDANADVQFVFVRFFDGRGFVVESIIFNANVGNVTQFSNTYSLLNFRGFLGVCNIEVRLIDVARNVSGPLMANIRDCTKPVLGGATVSVRNGDNIMVLARGGDPDANTTQANFQVRDINGMVLRTDTANIAATSLNRSDFLGIIDISGISALNMPGSVRVQLMDAQGQLSEIMEGTFTPVRGAPDLIVNSLTLSPSTVNAGGLISAEIVISNGGDAPVGGSMAEIRISADRTIDSRDTLLQTFSVPALPPGQFASGVRTALIPSNLMGGNFFIGVVADGGNSNQEANESNNVLAQQITVVTAADNSAPAVRVVTPRAGDVAMQGAPLSITYASSDNVAVVSHDIDLSLDGGASFVPLVGNLGGSTLQFVFNVPRDFITPSRRAVVRVTARDAAGNSAMATSELFSIGDLVNPTIQMVAPVDAASINAGQPVTIRFTGADNDQLSAFIVSYSTDGGATFAPQNGIARLGPGANQVVWNVPDNLQAAQARIQVVARDRSGNTAQASSPTFAVQRPQSTAPLLGVLLTFEPPQPGQAPTNLRAAASLFVPPGIVVPLRPLDHVEHLQFNSNADLVNIEASPEAELLGFNIYRVVQPAAGPLPTAAEIVANKNNLIASVGVTTSFTDVVSTQKGDNFVYAITSFFGRGETAASTPGATDIPVVKSPVFRQGTLSIAGSGAFIKSGAVLIIDNVTTFPLQADSAGGFTVPKNTLGTPNNVTIKKLIKKGGTVTLTVRNPDGKLSIPSIFTRR